MKKITRERERETLDADSWGEENNSGERGQKQSLVRERERGQRQSRVMERGES